MGLNRVMAFTANCIVIRKTVKVNFFTTDGKKKNVMSF